MKRIEKREEPPFFSDFITRHAPKHWEELAPVRAELRKHIMDEQGCCCAYTEVRLANCDACHIDHFKTRNLYPDLAFTYSNLLVSCNSETFGAKYKDKVVKSKTDYENIIHPAEESPYEHIEYNFMGRVLPRNGSKKGEATIQYFNLNDKRLCERRKTAINNYLKIKQDLSVDEAVMAVGEFETMIRELSM